MLITRQIFISFVYRRTERTKNFEFSFQLFTRCKATTNTHNRKILIEQRIVQCYERNQESRNEEQKRNWRKNERSLETTGFLATTKSQE